MNQWDDRYAADRFYYGTEPNDFLREQAGRIRAGGRALCIAEGEGRNAVYLAGLGCAVTAMDQSAVGLAKARALAERRGVGIDVVVGDLSTWAFAPGSWDAIVSIWCHLPAPLRGHVYRGVVTGLAPGGVLILEAYTPKQLEFGTGGPPAAELMPTLAELRRHLDGLDFEVAAELEREVHEGQGHHGHSAVVQVVARRPVAAVTSRPR